MSSNPDDQGSRRLQDWWLELPLSYRVNALLYFLGACALLFLVTTLFSGDDEPSQVEVGAGVTVPASTTTSRAGFPTSAPATVATTIGTTSTSTGPPPGSAPATTTAPSPTGAPEETTTTSPTQASTTTTIPPCRNSFDSRCGQFSWDPPPGPNEAMTISVVPRPGNPKPGDTVSFDVTVNDPDHLVDENCAEVSWGDGLVYSAPCLPQPSCPAVFGPWTPPSRQPGTFTKTYTHTYQATGQHTVRFTFRSWAPDRCAGLDPYASERVTQLILAVSPGT